MKKLLIFLSVLSLVETLFAQEACWTYTEEGKDHNSIGYGYITDGVFRLTDGTLVRIKGGEGNYGGAPISGELDFGDVKVAYSARGLFAARVENGKLVAFCGGEVTKVEGGGISLKPGKAADISLSMSGAGNDGGGEWRGIY